MKKGLLILMLLTSASIFAQSGFGAKAGLNYGDNGKMEYTDVTTAGEDIMETQGERKMGYHVGVFYRASMAGFFIKPELVYTEVRSSYQTGNETADYTVSKLDLPVLVGAKIVGPLNIFAGPSLQYVLDNDFQGVNLEDVENDFTIGAQFGAGIQLGGIGIDVRYERGLTDNQAEVLDLNNPDGVRRIDTRPNQFIVSLSLNL